MRKLSLLLMMITALVLAVVPASANGRHPKANGEVTWTGGSSQQIQGIYTKFSLHDRPGDDVRGSWVYMEVPTDGGVQTREIRVDCVQIEGSTATWSGVITASNAAAVIGQAISGWVLDAGRPGSDGDRIGTHKGVSDCEWGPGNGIVTAGNLTVFD